MMGGLKSPTMNLQDRQTRNAIKRNPSPNETRPHTLGIGPKPQNARIAKSNATAAHNILENISHLPLMLRHDRRAHRFADGNGFGKRRGATVHCSRQLLWVGRLQLRPYLPNYHGLMTVATPQAAHRRHR